MSASQPNHNALVGGLWNSFFSTLTAACANPSSTTTITHYDLFQLTRTSYFTQNVYELFNCVVHEIYAEKNKRIYSRFPVDLTPLLCSGEGGEPDYEQLRALQIRYRAMKVKIWRSSE
jgi:hypothetical protein